MTADHAARLRARFAEHRTPLLSDSEFDDVRKVLGELEQLRAELAEIKVLWAVEATSPHWGRYLVNHFTDEAEARLAVERERRRGTDPVLKWRRNYGPWHDADASRQLEPGGAPTA